MFMCMVTLKSSVIGVGLASDRIICFRLRCDYDLITLMFTSDTGKSSSSLA